ncbi:MAG: glycolate oxidase subunit GlcE [Hyphomicrobiales bacterium]|nr:glycolate oxidase subunit GlcE [Hyphomicrobiales bacterium]
MTVFQPSDAAEAAEVVAWAAAEGQSLEIVAGGSKRGLGRPPRADHRLDVSRLAGIVDYDPAELILTARAATPMAEIEAELKAKRQMLAFEPPDWRGLMGGDGEPTLGGVLACNFAGPRRVRAGAARDYFLGFSAINGWGEVWKAGGKVVKNVTGYDMCKLQAGAHGTLSVLTEATLKVMPRPETACTILLEGMADEIAIPELLRALNTPYEVSAAAHLPASVARRSAVEGVAQGLGAVTALRLEGPAPSVAFRANAIESLLGHGLRLAAAETERLWAEIGQVRGLLPSGRQRVWRLCPTPTSAPVVSNALRAQFDSAEAFYDWGGGLIWLGLDADEAGPDGGASRVRAAMREAGGHSTLVVAPDDVRARTAVFEPLHGALAALMKRVKSGFDPRGVLNPGRMHEGQ